jgi:hypoxanthine phosphoribosyltransferase
VRLKGESTVEEKIQEILLTEEKIHAEVKKLAERINNDYKGKNPILLVILKGSMIFAADLMREIKEEVTLDFMQVSSYGSGTVSGKLKILKDAQSTLSGKDVIVIEDIIDSGNTLKALTQLLKERGANVEICTLLSKPARREVEIDVKYVGLEIPDEFVVGYGLDYDESFRNLPYIGILKKEVYTS